MNRYYVIMDMFKSGNVECQYYPESEVKESIRLMYIVKKGDCTEKNYKRKVLSFKNEKEALKFVATRTTK